MCFLRDSGISVFEPLLLSLGSLLQELFFCCCSSLLSRLKSKEKEKNIYRLDITPKPEFESLLIFDFEKKKCCLFSINKIKKIVVLMT